MPMAEKNQQRQELVPNHKQTNEVKRVRPTGKIASRAQVAASQPTDQPPAKKRVGMPARQTVLVPSELPGRLPGQNLTDEQRAKVQETFLWVYAQTANVSAASKAAGIGRRTIYVWREHDTEFGIRFREAEQEALDYIRAKLHSVALVGWKEPMVSMGKVVYDKDGQMVMVDKYDSARLGQMASARLPEYRERTQVELMGKDGGAVEVRHTLAEALHDPVLTEYIHGLLERLADGGRHAGGTGLPRQ